MYGSCSLHYLLGHFRACQVPTLLKGDSRLIRRRMSSSAWFVPLLASFVISAISHFFCLACQRFCFGADHDRGEGKMCRRRNRVEELGSLSPDKPLLWVIGSALR